MGVVFLRNAGLLPRAILIGLLLNFVQLGPVSAEVVVIVNRGNPVTRLTRGDVEAIYLFKMITWKSGLKVVPINLMSRDPLRLELSMHWIQRSPGEIESFYLMRALSGQGQPPMIVKSPEEIKEQVRKTKGAIGYIERSDLDDTVKVVPYLEKDLSRR